MTLPTPRLTILGALWHLLTALGLALIVASLWLLVMFPRALLLALGTWIVYRVGRLMVYAFRNDARRFTR